MARKKIFIVRKEEEFTEKNIDFLIDFLKLLKNKNRRKVLELCYKEPRTIAELQRILNKSHKFMWHSIQDLRDAGLVTLEKQKHQKHQPVYVKSLFLPSEFSELFYGFIINNRKLFNVE
ncbi:MAG: winged helix-turn-helix domain-containing protein [Candidatus Pacearchaeota archaeon]